MKASQDHLDAAQAELASYRNMKVHLSLIVVYLVLFLLCRRLILFKYWFQGAFGKNPPNESVHRRDYPAHARYYFRSVLFCPFGSHCLHFRSDCFEQTAQDLKNIQIIIDDDVQESKAIITKIEIAAVLKSWEALAQRGKLILDQYTLSAPATHLGTSQSVQGPRICLFD